MQFFTITASSLLVAATASLSLVSAAPAVQMEERLLSGTPIISGSNAIVHLNYVNNFALRSCAVQSPDYMTYSIVNSVDDCLDFCDSVNGCKFANYYLDTNSVKANGYTCSLYRSTQGTSTLTNCGNQDQKGNGSKNSISQSSGWVKTF